MKSPRLCPVIGCLEERRGMMCVRCWWTVPRWLRLRLKDSGTPQQITARWERAIIFIICQSQALRVNGVYEGFTPSQETAPHAPA